MKKRGFFYSHKIVICSLALLGASSVFAQNVIELYPFYANVNTRANVSKNLPCTSTRKFSLEIDVRKLNANGVGKVKKLEVLAVRVGQDGLQSGQKAELISSGFEVIKRSWYQVKVKGLEVRTYDAITPLVNKECRFKTRFPVYATVRVTTEKGLVFTEEHRMTDHQLTL